MRFLILPIFAGLVSVDAVGVKARTSAIGSYAKVISVFEDQYTRSTVELDKAESALKELTCKCDKEFAEMKETQKNADRDYGYWMDQAATTRSLMEASSADVVSQRAALDAETDSIHGKSEECQGTQATYLSQLHSMKVQLAHTADAQTLVGQHLGKHVALDDQAFMQTGNKAMVHSQAYSEADAKIFTPDLKKLISDMMLKQNVRIVPEELKNVMAFLQAPTKKIAHAFAQTGRNDELTVDNATFEAVWNLLQDLVDQLKNNISAAETDMKKHASACQNWINILQVEANTAQSELDKAAENYKMYMHEYQTAQTNAAAALAAWYALEGNGAGQAPAWTGSATANAGNIGSSQIGMGAFTTNPSGDLEGCSENLAAFSGTCFGIANEAGSTYPTAQDPSNEDFATAYAAVFAKCNADGRLGAIAQCTSCGFDLTKTTTGAIKAPQRCRMKRMSCEFGKYKLKARIDTLNDEKANLQDAKQIMYQFEAQFAEASRFGNALFFLQTSEEQQEAGDNADLAPIANKMVALINSEQEQRATNAYNFAQCKDLIDDLKRTYDDSVSLLNAMEDQMDALNENMSMTKDSIRELTQNLNDIETQVHKAYDAHQDELAQLEHESTAMDPLIAAMTDVRDALMATQDNGGAFTADSPIIVLVDRLKDDLVHEKAQLVAEQTAAETDYENEDQQLADQKMALLTRRGDQQAQLAEDRDDLDDERDDHAQEKGDSQIKYDDYHQKTVQCSHLTSKYNQIQADLDAHISKLRQMLGVFSQLASLPDFSNQLHVSSDNHACTPTGESLECTDKENEAACVEAGTAGDCEWTPTYYAGYQSNTGDARVGENGGEDQGRISNKDNALNADPDTASESNAEAALTAAADHAPYEGGYNGNVQVPY